MNNEPSQELLKREFMHALVNVFACLGATPGFIDVIKQVEEKPFTAQSLAQVNNYAMEVWEGLKGRLNRCYTYTVKTDNNEE